jgi:hypothetical protein
MRLRGEGLQQVWAMEQDLRFLVPFVLYGAHSTTAQQASSAFAFRCCVFVDDALERGLVVGVVGLFRWLERCVAVERILLTRVRLQVFDGDNWMDPPARGEGEATHVGVGLDNLERSGSLRAKIWTGVKSWGGCRPFSDQDGVLKRRFAGR